MKQKAILSPDEALAVEFSPFPRGLRMHVAFGGYELVFIPVAALARWKGGLEKASQLLPEAAAELDARQAQSVVWFIAALSSN